MNIRFLIISILGFFSGSFSAYSVKEFKSDNRKPDLNKQIKQLERKREFFSQSIASLESFLNQNAHINAKALKETEDSALGNQRLFTAEKIDALLDGKVALIKAYEKKEKSLMQEFRFNTSPFSIQQLAIDIFYFESNQKKHKEGLIKSAEYEKASEELNLLLKAKGYLKAFQNRKEVLHRILQKDGIAFPEKTIEDTVLAQKDNAEDRQNTLKLIRTEEDINLIDKVIQEKKKNLYNIQKETCSSQKTDKIIFTPYLTSVSFVDDQNKYSKKDILFKISDSNYLNTEDFTRIKKWMVLLDFENSCKHILLERKNALSILSSHPDDQVIDKEFIFDILRGQRIPEISFFKKEGSFNPLWKNILESEAKGLIPKKEKEGIVNSYFQALYAFSDTRNSETLMHKMNEAYALILKND